MDKNFNKFLCWLLTWIAIILSLAIINMFVALCSIIDKLNIAQIFNKIYEKGVLNSFNTVLYTSPSKNFNNEYEKEYYPKRFLIILWVFLTFVKGSPIFDNYYGIYKEMEHVRVSNDFGKPQDIIVLKGREEKIIDNLENDENYYVTFDRVNTTSYLFIETGLIDGFFNYTNHDKGFIGYIKCLFFSFCEKLINTVLYFFIPFWLSTQYNKNKTDNIEQNNVKYGNK